METKAKEEKNKIEMERERLTELMGKVSFDVKALPNPLPVDIATFERGLLSQAKSKDAGSQKKGLGFGVGSRLPLSEVERWGIKLGKWNSHAEKPVDPTKDPMPGPMAYNLIATWGSKAGKKENQDGQKLPNIFKATSHGPKINAYYAHL